jgi:uncharacterized integral membrane protein (TIGR00698 family)
MFARNFAGILPGLGLSSAIALVSVAIERVETALVGRPWVDGLVFAILIGTAFHTFAGMHPRYKAGIHFSSKLLLEIAIVMLGASISFAVLGEAGVLFGAVVVAVIVGLATSYAIGRALGLPDRLATLVACGNSICGNSAIVAAAPVIEAESEDVAASIAFTAALGVIVVLVLPLVQGWTGISQERYGIIAGMTVYAVPQVLAATVPVGAVSVQMGALVKLMRVLMLGPVVFLLGIKTGRKGGNGLSFTRMVPWFIVGFLLMMACRSLGAIPDALEPPLKETSTILTIVSMAALGLSVDIRTVLASGGRVLAAGVLSLLVLAGLSSLTAMFLLF